MISLIFLHHILTLKINATNSISLELAKVLSVLKKLQGVVVEQMPSHPGGGKQSSLHYYLLSNM